MSSCHLTALLFWKKTINAFYFLSDDDVSSLFRKTKEVGNGIRFIKATVSNLILN